MSICDDAALLILKYYKKNGTAKPSIAASMIQAFPGDDPKEKAYQEQIAINVAGTAFLGKPIMNASSTLMVSDLTPN